MLKGLCSETIIPTAKHFPGHGDTAIDSHVGLPVVNKTLDQLNNLEFKPFVEAIKNNVEMIKSVQCCQLFVHHLICERKGNIP